MTQEEAKKILSGYVKACNEDDFPTLEMFEYEEVIEAMTMGANALSKPSLPSNLDEAAEEYRDTEVCTGSDYIDDDGDSLYRSFALKDAFKAGAEWMAEQGVTVKGLLYGGSLGIPDIPEEFYTDKEEEVIVQIRKK